jgi:hypothetical protein
MATRRVVHRPDRVVEDAQQLLVRFGQDADVAQALRLALISSHLYGEIPGYEPLGAICVSAFLVESESEARTMLEDVIWGHYGLATAGAIRSAGYEVIGTDIEEDGELIPLSDRHVDVVVAAYPDGLAPYDDLTRHERRAVREALITVYERALRLFDPRREADDGGVR